MVPFAISGSVRIPVKIHSNAATVKAFATRLAGMLDEKGVSEVFIEGNRVRFRNALFGGTIRFGDDFSDETFLGVFGSGTFDIEAGFDGVTIRFNLSLIRYWIGLALFLATFWYFQPALALDWRFYWPFPAAPFAGVVALYFAITWGRVKYWLKHELAEVSDQSMRV